MASLGGGPGYELLAFDWFIRYWRAVGRAAHDARVEWLAAQTLGIADGAKGGDGGGDGGGAGGDGGDGGGAGGGDGRGAGGDDGADGGLVLGSLDLQPSWAPYVTALQQASGGGARYLFAEWDVHGGASALDVAARVGIERIDVAIISNVRSAIFSILLSYS